jgi:hypothetical protein
VEGQGEEDEDEDENSPKAKRATQLPTKRAAAAMVVDIGSFSDPPEAEGLAHFLEHMLFMGSEKYPDENEYDSYLTAHGGCCNAITEASASLCSYSAMGVSKDQTESQGVSSSGLMDSIRTVSVLLGRTSGVH